MFLLTPHFSCPKRQRWENSLLAMFFFETVMTQGNHHYLVTQVNYQLLPDLSRPLGEQAGESSPPSPLLFLVYTHRHFSWEAVATGSRECMNHFGLRCPERGLALSASCSPVLGIALVLWGLSGGESAALSQSMRIASGPGRCWQRR